MEKESVTAVEEPTSQGADEERRRRPLWAQWSRTSETPEVHYTPRGGGFEVRLIAGGLELTARGAGLDTEPEVTGNEELTANIALTALVLGHAANELAYRRSRSPEKRANHRKAADAERKDAVALAELVIRRGDQAVSQWCSGCFAETEHRHVRGADRPRRTYLCDACGTPTVGCAVPGCSHHAVIRPRTAVTLAYCAEHRHEIPGFAKLDAPISTLDDYGSFLKHEVRNATRITKVAGGSIAAAAVMAPVALLAAPAVGAALGSSMLGGSLTGAAATSHGLAMLGGGAVASGGLGMAGGTVVVTATGTALGGALGAATLSAYAGADRSFAIERVREGTGTPVVFAAGFLSEGIFKWGDWQKIVDTRYPRSTVYQVHWGAKELKDLAVLVGTSSGKAAVQPLLVQAARRGNKGFGLPGLGWALAAHDVVANPWTVAKTRAGMTGAALAELIARTLDGPYVLMGHSLGARVMVTAAQALGTRPGQARIETMHLFGAAVDRKDDWRSLQSAVTGTVWNYWSSNDLVLRWLYRLAEAGKEAAGQQGFGSKLARIKDRNVSRSVNGHSGYLSSVKLAE
jgi:pimeloyl-ACP methyl ester carboxylesterase